MDFRLSKIEFLSIGIILFLGTMCLYNPFYGDQSFFLLGAKEMNHHAVLYKDFWDIKQPGIFIFYLIGSKIFGFTSFGIHLFELLIWLAFSYFLLLFYKSVDVFKNKNLNSLAVVLTVGLYYLNASVTMLTQVESIVNIPLQIIIILHFITLHENSRRKYIFLLVSGILGGIVIQFKLVFILILIPIYGVFFICDIYNYTFFKTFRNIGIILLGSILSLVPFLIYIHQHNLFDLVFQTFFVYPVKIVSQSGQSDITRLISSIKGFFKPLIALLIPAIIALIFRRKHLLVICYLVWIIAASVVIIMQKTSWWQYHFQLFIIPLGVLSALGIDVFWDQLTLLKSRRMKLLTVPTARTLILIMLFLPSAVKLSYKIYYYISYVSSSGPINADSFACYLDYDNYLARKNTYFLLRDNSLQGPIFVAGNPLIYQYAKREQAVALNGWSLEYFQPDQWNELLREIEDKKPCYIFIDFINKNLISNNSKKFLILLRTRYFFDHQNKSGFWYRINNSGDLKEGT
jgi:hypothetical protein